MTLRQIETEDAKCGTKGTRSRVERNMRQGAPANAEELMQAARAAASAVCCARCGKELPAAPGTSRYVPLAICDLCAVQEAGLELMNNPLPFRLWHCCVNGTEPVLTRPTVDPEEPELWYCRGKHGADAVGIFEQGSITILQGSRVADQMTPDFEQGRDSAGRKRLLEDGTIDSSFTFTRDVHFSFPSAAGKVVLGRSCNGWTSWVNEDGELLEKLRYK